jgi:hypothetical protein
MITASHTLKIAKQPTSSPRRTVNRIRRRTVSMAEITNLCSAPLRKRVDERALRTSRRSVGDGSTCVIAGVIAGINQDASDERKNDGGEDGQHHFSGRDDAVAIVIRVGRSLLGLQTVLLRHSRVSQLM